MSVPRVDRMAEPPVDTTGLSRGLSQYPAKVASLPQRLDGQPRVLGGVPLESTGPTLTDLARWQGELDHRLARVEARVKEVKEEAKDGRGVRLVATIWLGVIALSLLVFSGYVVFGDLDSGAEPDGPTLTGVPTWTA